MRFMSMSIQGQLRRNAVAIISLVIALSGLAYNTWRNELTEENRNIRQSGFELLVRLADFQRVVFLAHYDGDHQEANPRIGWAHVIAMKDFAEMMGPEVSTRADHLRDVWQARWTELGKADKAEAELDQAMNALRSEIRVQLESLQ
jgi:hypothetical protein